MRTDHFRRSAFVAVTLAAGAALVLAGCTAAAPGTGEGDVPTSATIALETRVTELDPNATTSVVSLQVMSLIAGTLIEITNDGLQPGLAQSWETSEDGLTFTATLRPDLTFSDGTPLTAADVAATWAYFLDDEANVNAGQIAPIDEVEAIDDSTVVFHLASPFPSLDNVLTRPSYLVMPADRVGDADFMLEPISAGPYALSEWGGGDTIVLTRNESYPGAQPLLEQVIFSTISESASRVAQLQSGQIDVATNLPPTVVDEVSAPITVSMTPQYGGTYIYMNDRSGPLSEVGVRQAISRAIDRQAMSDITFSGKAPVMDSFFPSTMSAYMPSFPVEPDIAEAKELLVGTACETGCTIELLMRSAGTQAVQQIGVILQQQLAEIGITVQISQVDDSVWGEALNGSFEMTIDTLSDAADIPDAMLNLGLISDGGVSALFSGYSSEAMDTAAREVISSSGEQREAALKKVNEIFAADMPYVPLIELVYVSATDLKDGLVFQMPSSFFDVKRAQD